MLELNNLPVTSLPAVCKIVQDAEDRLKEVLGLNIKVKLAFDNGITQLTPIDIVQSAICQVSDVPWREIAGKKRHEEIVEARHVYCYVVKKFYPEVSLKSIGRSINMSDHTSVIHALQHIQKKIDTNNPSTMHLIRRVENLLLAS